MVGKRMKIRFSNAFKARMPNFDDNTKQAILEFIAHTEQHGLKGLAGRNKSSADLTDTTKKGIQRAKYAQKHCLWHYHIGIPEYVGEHGDMTSQMVLHYIRQDEFIVLVDIAQHPPFKLPEESLLK